jgi:hypothetical protein
MFKLSNWGRNQHSGGLRDNNTFFFLIYLTEIKRINLYWFCWELFTLVGDRVISTCGLMFVQPGMCALHLTKLRAISQQN